MSLRSVLTSTIAILGVLAIGAAVAIMVLAGRMHVVMTDLEDAAQNVRLSQDLSIDLLSFDRARDAAKRERLVQSIRRRLDALARRSEDAGEDAPARQVQRAVSAYLASRTLAVRVVVSGTRAEDTAPREAAEAELEQAQTALERLSDAYVAQAEVVHGQTMGADETATVVAVGVALALVLGFGALLVWLRHELFHPVFELGDAVQRSSRGARGVRAPEEGAAEIRRIAQHFNELNAALERQRENRIAFLGGVAHDLRNPLSVLKVSTRIIAPDKALPSEAQLRKTLALVRRQVERLERMTSDLVDAAQLEAGRIELELEEADLNALATEVFDLFEGESPDHELRLELPAAELTARCDPTRLVRVLNNLVSNAIKYSPDGGRVTLRCAREQDGVCLSVSDQGVGISELDQRRIFDPFQRVNGAGRKTSGAGLGLFVARRIVEAHGGAVEVESRPGAGSTFRVRLRG